MDDLTITRLCAEAMGVSVHEYQDGSLYHFGGLCEGGIEDYDPLHDDAQSMALVKKFDLSIWGKSYSAGEWKYHAEFCVSGEASDAILGHGLTHNRAICECVAQMQKENN